METFCFRLMSRAEKLCFDGISFPPGADYAGARWSPGGAASGHDGGQRGGGQAGFGFRVHR
jgi:hypothetical protein